MNTGFQLYKKFSIGISFYKMRAEDWISILQEYQSYINDIFFSPIESIAYQTRRNVYNYETQTQEYLDKELSKVLEAAKRLGIYRKIVLNVPALYNRPDELVSIYLKYKNKYDVEYVTTFLQCARKIREIDTSQSIVCSYNQGIKNHIELERILDSDVFNTIVIGTNFFRDIVSFRLIHKYGKSIELLLNNGCMTDCESFCRLSNSYCKSNFEKHLSNEDINALYAKCSMFPEEVHRNLLPLNIIDYFKISTRPIHYGSMTDMLSSYIEGDSSKYISARINNYNLYGRLAHFHQYYELLDYDLIIKNKEFIWDRL